jgi:transposase
MRGDDLEQQGAMWSYVPLEQRIPADHPLRVIRVLVDAVLEELSPRFAELYSRVGQPSIAPERLLRALLLQVLYTIRSERLLMEQLDYNLLFRDGRSGLERHRVHEKSGAPPRRGDRARVL